MKRYGVVSLNMSRLRDWKNGIVNRNFFMARELERQTDIGPIIHVDVLPHRWQRAARVIVEDRLVPPFFRVTTLEKGKRYHIASALTPISETAFLRRLQATIHHLLPPDYLLWSYLPTYVRAFAELKPVVSVFDAVDDWSQHPNYRSWKGRIVENYRFLDRIADCIFTVASSLRSLFPTNKNVHWIPNGADTSHFALSRNAAKEPTLCYVGTIQERVNLALLARLARERPEYMILIAGQVFRDIDIRTLARFPNVRFVGRIPWQRLPEFLTRCHVGLIPHFHNEFTNSMNPMKIYDYLSAGLPVVAMGVADIDGFRDGVTIADTDDAFLAACDHAITTPLDPARLRALVADQTWARRFQSAWHYSTLHMHERTRS